MDSNEKNMFIYGCKCTLCTKVYNKKKINFSNNLVVQRTLHKPIIKAISVNKKKRVDIS